MTSCPPTAAQLLHRARRSVCCTRGRAGRRGSPTERSVTAAARFAVSERVRAANAHPADPTHLDRYARSRSGRVEQVHGVRDLPGTGAYALGQKRRWLDAVSFDGHELWGCGADAARTVFIPRQSRRHSGLRRSQKGVTRSKVNGPFKQFMRTANPRRATHQYSRKRQTTTVTSAEPRASRAG